MHDKPEEPRRDVSATVRAFYDELPFNAHQSVRESATAVRENQIEANYPDLHALLRSGEVESVLEIGCGAGWLSNSLALHYSVSITAVDFCGEALQRARDLADEIGTASRVRFLEHDLFDYEHPTPCDLVISLGVLHHTEDCERAFRHVQRFSGPDKFVYIGLYHEPGRRVFLDMFREILDTHGEAAAFARYRENDHVHDADETLARSWFRDQVIHPHETQHTLREACGWLADCGLRLQSTSINGFAPIESVPRLFDLELKERSRRANVEEGRYFPGFFTFLATRIGTER